MMNTILELEARLLAAQLASDVAELDALDNLEAARAKRSTQ